PTGRKADGGQEWPPFVFSGAEGSAPARTCCRRRPAAAAPSPAGSASLPAARASPSASGRRGGWRGRPRTGWTAPSCAPGAGRRGRRRRARRSAGPGPAARRRHPGCGTSAIPAGSAAAACAASRRTGAGAGRGPGPRASPPAGWPPPAWRRPAGPGRRAAAAASSGSPVPVRRTSPPAAAPGRRAGRPRCPGFRCAGPGRSWWSAPPCPGRPGTGRGRSAGPARLPAARPGHAGPRAGPGRPGPAAASAGRRTGHGWRAGRASSRPGHTGRRREGQGRGWAWPKSGTAAACRERFSTGAAGLQGRHAILRAPFRAIPSMFESLTQRLSGTLQRLRGRGRLTEENIREATREVRIALLEADVALPVVAALIERIKARAVGQEVLSSLTPGQALIKVVRDELAAVMGASAAELNLNVPPPAVILMAGLQGAGKTTTVGKLGKFLKERRKKKVLVVSADVYRPAAIEQLRTLAEQVGVGFFPSDPGQKPEDIVRAAIDEARRTFADVLLVDTAGRLAVDEAMMAEIKALHAAAKPAETLFVVDSMTGQDAANTAKAFAEALPLTGVVLTKTDGGARGGAVLSVRYVTCQPIKF